MNAGRRLTSHPRRPGKNAKRTGGATRDALRDLRERRPAKLHPHGFVFTNARGEPIRPGAVSELWYDALRKLYPPGRGRPRNDPNGRRGLVKSSDARRGLRAAVVAAEQPGIADHRLSQNRGPADAVGELATELREQAVHVGHSRPDARRTGTVGDVQSSMSVPTGHAEGLFAIGAEPLLLSAVRTIAASKTLPLAGPRDSSRRTGSTRYASSPPIGHQLAASRTRTRP